MAKDFSFHEYKRSTNMAIETFITLATGNLYMHRRTSCMLVVLQIAILVIEHSLGTLKASLCCEFRSNGYTIQFATYFRPWLSLESDMHGCLFLLCCTLVLTS